MFLILARININDAAMLIDSARTMILRSKARIYLHETNCNTE